jgi:hypothetical protein
VEGAGVTDDLRTARVPSSEDDMVADVWQWAPPGSKLAVHRLHVSVVPGGDLLFIRTALPQAWDDLAEADPWEFAKRLSLLAYGRDDAFTEP